MKLAARDTSWAASFFVILSDVSEGYLHFVDARARL
jgi:hypothetical protein